MSHTTASALPDPAASRARERTPLVAPDLSSFAKTLRTQLAERMARGDGLPGHVEMLNLLARAAGHRNVQALRAAAQRTPTPRDAAGPALTPTAERVLRAIDAQGRLLRWPTRRSEQLLALWCVWMPFDGKRPYTEREVNEVINHRHTFGDHCLLRRELVELRLLSRTPGGAQYRKMAARPSEEAAALMRAVRQRSAR